VSQFKGTYTKQDWSIRSQKTDEIRFLNNNTIFEELDGPMVSAFRRAIAEVE
jgi:hypothetical protein